PLLAKRPSWIVGSARKMTCSAPPAGGGGGELAKSAFAEKDLVCDAGFGVKPSCRHFRHHDSETVAAAGAGGGAWVLAARGFDPSVAGVAFEVGAGFALLRLAC